MIAIIDNDVIAKLARFDLLIAFHKQLKKLKYEPRLTPLIDSTFDLAGKSPVPKKVRTLEQRQVIAELAAGCSRIALNDEGHELLKLCYQVEGIDPGDSIWLCVAASTPDSIVFTGDKRALRSVSASNDCAPIVKRLAGRVVCLEQIVVGLFDEEGYPVVRSRIRLDPEADGAVSSAFPEKVTSRADAMLVLEGKIATLRASTGGLLVP